MLSFLHFGLLAANQTQRDPSSVNPTEAVIAKGKELRKAGKFAEALREYNRALIAARESKNTELTVRCLMLVSSAELLSFQYQSAMTAAKEALEMARTAGNFQLAGGASGTISSIYMMLGDSRTAEVEGRRAINLLKRAPQIEQRTRDFLVRALHIVATLDYLQGKPSEGEIFFQQAIGLAQHLGDKRLEAGLWDDRGVVLLRANQLAPAEQSLNRALSLRQSAHDEDFLPISKEHLAELELKRSSPNFVTALKLIDEAFSSHSPAFSAAPRYYPIHIRAQILLRSGEKQRALAEFRRAVSAADAWRQGALPGDITNTQTVVLLHEVYRDFAQLAAQLSLENANPPLKIEALQVLASNRAASLREQLKLSLTANSKFPDTYFEKLSALQAAQERVTLGSNSKSDQTELTRLRAEITDFENKIALQNGNTYFSDEKNLRRNSLRSIQARLGKEQLLLSFSLGETKSYLWAITGDQVDLYQLDNREKIERKAIQFTQAVRTGVGIRDSGQVFGQSIFGALPSRLLQKPEWLIVADGALLNGVPFASLPAFPSGDNGSSLVDKHSLRFLPSELLLLSAKTKSPAERFVGVADPIYNLADSRLRHGQGWDAAPVEASSVTLARLAGSLQEIRNSAQHYGIQNSQFLDGFQASEDALRKALLSPPELLHFAVHVVSPPDRPQEAALALSLKNGVPELLTPEAIATFRLPGTLVVLSGCSSNQGQSLPSAGLLGLSRAWLLAGAEAVIASSWPTPDDSGRFFSLFYSHLRAANTGSTMSRRAALALAQTQADLRHSSGYTSSPHYWAAYSIISKE